MLRVDLKTESEWTKKTIIKGYKALVLIVNYGKHSSWTGHSINMC